jgi:hypothetical protein
MQQTVHIEVPRWFASAEEKRLRIVEHKADPFGDEIAVRIQAGDKDEEAIVPARAVDLEKQTVLALLIGEVGEDFLLSLPASSLGMKRLRLSREDLHTLTEKKE